MTRKTLWTVVGAGIAGIVLTLAVLWSTGQLGFASAGTGVPAVAPASPPGIVTLDPDNVAASGIEVTALQSTTTRASTGAVGTVVDLSPLADLTSSAASAEAQWRAARARSALSSAAYQRDKALFADDQNVSQAELQTARAGAAADRAAVDAARASLASATFALEQQFGPAIGRWPLGPAAQALAAHRSVLVQVSTAAEVGMPPQRVRLTAASGRTVTARYVSPAVRTDPRIQGNSFFYIAPADRDLLAGATVNIALPRGPQLTGAMVPSDSVIVWQGQSWIYRQTASGRFRRVAVDTQVPVDGGYLDPALAAGTRIVTRGAQLLLSQEMQPPPGAAPAGGDDDD